MAPTRDIGSDSERAFGFDPEQLGAYTRALLNGLGEVGEELKDLTGRAESADGQVSAAFSEERGPHDLVIQPRAMRRGAAELAETVTRVIEAARADLRARARALASEAFGDLTADESTVAQASNSAKEALDRSLRNGAALIDRLRDLTQH